MRSSWLAAIYGLGSILGLFGVLHAASAETPEGIGEVEEILVTGSRIRRDPLSETTSTMEIGKQVLESTGLTNLGDALQNLPITGSAPNSQFNVPGNSGFPQDGSGIGAGSVQLSLRNLGAKRTLVLVDGRRWIPGSSASGVPSSVDLNSIPDNMIERIEILQDGASAIYGSDAIGGVVNIITDRDFQGLAFDAQTGGYLSEKDGESTALGVKWGRGSEASHLVLGGSWRDELGIETADRSRSAFPNPDATSCDVPGSYCSSFTPQGRFVFGPEFAHGASITLNQGVSNDGARNIPVFDPANPDSGDFHAFTSADRFNYNGPTFNYLRTPNERVNLFASARHRLASRIEMFGLASYNERKSATKAAPEPLCLGMGCGNRYSDNFFISAQNPYNPFGRDLSVADGTLEFFGRRPLESGGRLFFQDASTHFATIGLEGQGSWRGRPLYWDTSLSYGENQGFQKKYNSHNARKLQVAMGDPAECAATPGCVPFNFFGGQGAEGNGSITPEMRSFVTYTQRDHSQQSMRNFGLNLSGSAFSLAAGEAEFAAGIEYRDREGWFRPDPIAERGETAGIPAGRTEGEFKVTEVYAELSLPVIANDAKYWEIILAARNSDYSTSGAEATYKISSVFQPVKNFSLRGSLATGFRAPGIGELFGGAAREDFSFQDPCSDVLAQYGSANGGRDQAQPQTIIDNCGRLGVPLGFVQTNPQLSAVSAGNTSLAAETSQSFALGLVWSAKFDFSPVARLTAEMDYHHVEINNAIQGRSPGDVLLACINTLDPLLCDLAPRTVNGAPDLINNQLQNIGGIEASGFDMLLALESQALPLGTFKATFNATFLKAYKERTRNVDGSQTLANRTGTHTDETFQRAFPELRWMARVDWVKHPWAGTLVLRWTHDMMLDGGGRVDSALFTDLRISFSPRFGENSWKMSLGLNNVFDEDPPLCFPCGVIGMSQVVHDLPGRVGYLRVEYSQES